MTKRITALALALLMLFGTFSALTANAAEVKILGTLTIKVGETKPLKFTDPNGNVVAVIWESSDPSIATVDDKGNVKAKKVGTCVMSAWWNGKVYGVNVKVEKAAAKKKKIALSKTKATLTVGKQTTLKLKNATASKVKWSSFNKKIATVSAKGVVKAKKAGKVTIKAKYKGKTYKCVVTVKKATSAQVKAFNKLKKFLTKNGEKHEYQNETAYVYEWEKDGFTYQLIYFSKEKSVWLQAYSFAGGDNSGKAYMAQYVKFKSKGKAYCEFGSYKGDDTLKFGAKKTFKRSNYKKSSGLNYEHCQGTDPGQKERNNQANAFLQWTLPEFNSKMKSKTGVTLKQLGFKNWNK